MGTCIRGHLWNRIMMCVEIAARVNRADLDNIILTKGAVLSRFTLLCYLGTFIALAHYLYDCPSVEAMKLT